MQNIIVVQSCKVYTLVGVKKKYRGTGGIFIGDK